MAEFDGKWLAGVHPHDALSTAARVALLARLHSVYSWAPLAMHFGLPHTEYVHHLRVATRRSHVAIRVFHQVIPEKLQRRWLNRLRKIRQQAGPARDLDVLLDRWRTLTDGQRNTEELLRRLDHRRRELQQTIRRKLATHHWERYPREWEELIHRVHWRGPGPEPDWATAALGALQRPFRDYLRAGKRLLTDSDHPDVTARLHAFRIQGKRVRYRLELGRGALANGPHRTLLRRLSKLQQRLGQINDHAVGIRSLQRWLRDDEFVTVREPLKSWLATERSSLRAEVRRFARQFTRDEWERMRQEWHDCKPLLHGPPPRDDSSSAKKRAH